MTDKTFFKKKKEKEEEARLKNGRRSRGEDDTVGPGSADWASLVRPAETPKLLKSLIRCVQLPSSNY